MGKSIQEYSDDEQEFEFDSDQEFESFEEEEEKVKKEGQQEEEGDTLETNDGQTDAEKAEKQKASKLEQKKLKLERKLQKPHSELILEAKKIWEDLRQKRLSKQERRELMDKMMEIVKGKVLDIIYKHDASRIIQCCVKYGSPDQRDQVAKELSGNFAKLSQCKYGRFIVSKVLQYCSPVYRAAVISDFHGKVRKLIRHKEASLVLDEAYSQYANAAQRSSLMEEFYGPEFAIFKTTNGPRTLQDLIASQPLKKQYILKHIRTAIDSVLEKASFNVGKTPILHRAIYDYLTVAEAAACRDLIELLKDHLVHMLHTREGARVAQYCLLYASPKDRKHIVKSFKGFIHSIAKEQYGHAVLLSCFECIDDTVLVGKALITELFKPASAEFLVNELLRDQYGSRVILFLLCGRNKRYQPAYIIKELQETDAIRAETSKKDPESRYAQLLEFTLPLLIPEVARFADELIRDKAGSTVLLETCNNAPSADSISAITEAVLNQVQSALDSGVVLDVAEPSEVVHVVKKLKAERDKQKQKDQGIDMDESVLVGRSSSLAIKLLLAKIKDEEKQPEWKNDFALKVWTAVKPHFEKLVSQCISNPYISSSLTFILISLFETCAAEQQKEMKKAIKGKIAALKSQLEKATSAKKSSDAESTNRKRKQKDDAPRRIGAEILVDHLI